MSDDGIYLLDASAVITLLEDEDGAGRVEEILLKGFVLVPFVTLLEVYYITLQERGETVAMQRHELLKRLPATLLWQMDEPVLLAAARFKASQRISLADAIVAGFASVYGAVLIHKDPEFEVLAGKTMMEALPYK